LQEKNAETAKKVSENSVELAEIDQNMVVVPYTCKYAYGCKYRYNCSSTNCTPFSSNAKLPQGYSKKGMAPFWIFQIMILPYFLEQSKRK